MTPQSGETVVGAIAIDNVTNDPMYFPPDIPATVVRTIPAIVHADGAHGAAYRSDLFLFNPADGVRTVRLLVKSWSTNEAEQTLLLTLLPRESKAIRDVLLTAFGRTGVARLRFQTDGGADVSGGVRVTSRTYTAGPSGGTYGLLLPALNAFQSAGGGESLEILLPAGGSGFRTNLALVELTTAFVSGPPVSVRVEVFDERGVLRDTFETPVPLAGGVQIDDLFHGRGLGDGPPAGPHPDLAVGRSRRGLRDRHRQRHERPDVRGGGARREALSADVHGFASLLREDEALEEQRGASGRTAAGRDPRLTGGRPRRGLRDVTTTRRTTPLRGRNLVAEALTARGFTDSRLSRQHEALEKQRDGRQARREAHERRDAVEAAELREVEEEALQDRDHEEDERRDAGRAALHEKARDEERDREERPRKRVREPLGQGRREDVERRRPALGEKVGDLEVQEDEEERRAARRAGGGRPRRTEPGPSDERARTRRRTPRPPRCRPRGTSSRPASACARDRSGRRG